MAPEKNMCALGFRMPGREGEEGPHRGWTRDYTGTTAVLRKICFSQEVFRKGGEKQQRSVGLGVGACDVQDEDVKCE